jgi:hypothetical protein
MFTLLKIQNHTNYGLQIYYTNIYNSFFVLKLFKGYFVS